ncbi:hypothetical protein NHX12_032787 [Muraenolepis orangiensis]|uniref:Fibronectin type-III domain-containing protein n=1 Tax=Muraenolepis orangiensis TaxID=630683 RepID=A0A9Q0E2Q4_9TELE|nr:hypothetical protein NHX12_032787 [Muraenolepis orangiensis]
MLGVLVSVVLLSHGAWGSEAGGSGQPPRVGAAVDLPRHHELCCAVLPPAHSDTEGDTSGARPPPRAPPPPSAQHPTCRYSGRKNTSQHRPSGGCRPKRPTAESQMRRPPSPSSAPQMLDNTKRSFAMATIAALHATGLPVPPHVPVRPVQLRPPVNMTHTQTVEGRLVLRWSGGSGPRRYQVRYAFNGTTPVWQELHVSGEPRVFLDLSPRLNYTFQARCSLQGQPPLWSPWSRPHHIYLDTVSYIPEKVVVKPGQNVTVYCVFNNRSANASSAVWQANFKHPIPHRQYTNVSRWVSQITVLPSKNRLYDLLQCTQDWNIPYSQIYVEGAAIAITCETNGDIDAMTCSWANNHMTKLNFLSRWADVPCDVMERRERAGKVVGETKPATCQRGRPGNGMRSCTIHPLRMSCYKLWLEVDSRLGPIRSRAIYVSPTDHVKPHQPSNVEAVSESRRVLRVRWEPPFLPVEGLQCQLRYHSPSTASAQPEWKVQNPTLARWVEVSVPDMCRVYVVQVRCMSTRGTGSWSDWSESVYSVPQNSRAPDNGPDFWRVLEDDPQGNTTNVTLLLKHLPMEERSYCVDGFVVQHLTPGGSVVSEKIDMVSAYSFEWNQEVHTVTVAAYNSLGSSTANVKMTLDRRFKRRCVDTFHVEVLNSSCLALRWTLLSNSTAPLATVVQWGALGPLSAGEPWARLPYTEHTQYLRGDFSAAEMYGFTLYPVFADGEGEPAYSMATRRDPAAYPLLVIFTLLLVMLFVTLVLSQNQMKRLVWKDVPNPYNCSWAKGLDLKKANTIDHLFQVPDPLPGWPFLLPAEIFCEAVIVDKKNNLPPCATASDRVPAVSVGPDPGHDTIFSIASAPSLAPGSALGTAASSSQSSVTYATVLLRDPSEPSVRLSYNSDGSDGSGGGGGGGSSSSDEGNFSADNSSGLFRGGLWELESCRGDPRRSCSYNSVEEFSEEDEGAKEEKDLYYLGIDYKAEEEEEEEEGVEDEGEEREAMALVLLKSIGSNVSLGPEEEEEDKGEEADPDVPADFSPVYRPQFKTTLCTRPLGREALENAAPSGRHRGPDSAEV